MKMKKINIEEKINIVRKGFGKQNLLMSFTVSKTGSVKLFSVERMNEDVQTNALLEAEESDKLKELKDFRRITG